MKTINPLRFRESFVSRLVITFLILSIVPTAIMGLVGYFQGRNMLQSSSSLNIDSNVELGALSISHWIDGEIKRLELGSNNNTFQESAFQDPNNTQAVYRVMLLTALKDLHHSVSEAESVGFVWLSGDQLSDDGKMTNISDREYFQRTVSTGRSTVSATLVTSKITGNLVFAIDVPVIKNEKVVGVINTLYPADKTEGLLKSVLDTADSDASVYLVDNSGTIFSSTDPSLSKKNLNTDFSSKERELFEGTLKGEKRNSGLVLRDGRLDFVSYAPIPGTSWIVGYSTPSSKVLSPVNWLFKVFLITLIVTVIVVIIIGYFMSLSIAKPILELVETTNTLAQGDMTVSINTRYIGEVGALARSIARLVDNFTSLLLTARDTATQASSMTEQILGAANQSSQAIQQVSSTIQSVASGAQETARNMGDASQAVDSISKKIEDLAQTASSVEQTTQDTIKLTQEGQEVVDELNRGFSQTTQATNSVVSSMDELEKAAGEIGRIIETITSISSQTNLLALNAAIEAARAGEAGRGFAVVADEVRKLAEESNQSAQRISQFIDQIRSQIANTAKNTEEAVKTISRQMEIGSRVVDAFKEIDQATNRVVQMIQDITNGITELVGDARTISQSVQGVAAIAQENAASSEEVSAATEEMTAAIEEITANITSLSELVKGLEEIILRFKMG
ncbi:MAG: methyl-accepting chemotaxis protein [bacterium]